MPFVLLVGQGLNLAFGTVGLLTLGHAAFFGIDGDAMGIPIIYAKFYAPILTSHFVPEGTKAMLLIGLGPERRHGFPASTRSARLWPKPPTGLIRPIRRENICRH
ncbi:hypothetical protein [Maritimibacter sp. HL-12]|uniref:hypothetical protein n=1 Tax=Maritimibacter sp. HL-12 TaxID=1162418 RepID=UPI000A1CC242|nr:hypothetical protein [Maritimibacter sp. HL-12]